MFIVKGEFYLYFSGYLIKLIVVLEDCCEFGNFMFVLSVLSLIWIKCFFFICLLYIFMILNL